MNEADEVRAAHQAAAQAAAIAIQDSVDALRNATTIATAASGAALVRFLASGDPRFLEAIVQTGGIVESAISNYGAILAHSARFIDQSAAAEGPVGAG